MLKFQISEFEKRVEQGWLKKEELGQLALYTYTNACVYEKAWDEYTRLARGLILHKASGMVVAMPFPKFFNLGEMPETSLENLPKEPYRVFEKVDGSLGILYFWEGRWCMATRGSLTSEQAVKGLEILHQKYPRFLEFANIRMTYLTEIIYPGNKVVVDYRGEEKLVLLGGYNTETGEEMPHTEFCTQSVRFHMPAVVDFLVNIDEAVAQTKTMGKNTEGFVIRFENGLRVKLKGEEYARIHRIISELSPLSLWAVMKGGRVPETYLMQIPEEYRPEADRMSDELMRSYAAVLSQIIRDFAKMPRAETMAETRKAIGLFLNSPVCDVRHPGAMFPMLLERFEAVSGYILSQIRPNHNSLPEDFMTQSIPEQNSLVTKIVTTLIQNQDQSGLTAS